MRVNGRTHDAQYDYIVKPAYRRDPHPGFDASCIIAWCVAFPLSAMIGVLALARVIRFLVDLHSPLH